MREARMKLFEFDTLNQLGCDIDTEVGLYTEPVDWTVDEPNISAEFGVHVDAEDIELSDSDEAGGYSDSDPDHNSDDDSDGDSDVGSDGDTHGHLDEYPVDYEGESISEDHDHAEGCQVSRGVDGDSEYAERLMGVEDGAKNVVADE